MKSYVRYASALGLIFGALLLGCGGAMKMQSQWRDRDILVDGAHREWHGGMTVLEKKEMSLGFFNDDEFLYISLLTSDRMFRRQFMLHGFTIWFDPDGGRQKHFGIRFPIGMMEMGIFRGRERHGSFETVREDFEKSMGRLELTVPGLEEPINLAVAQASGIEVRAGTEPEYLVYEIKVPLRKSDETPYAIAAQMGKSLGIGFETSAIDMAALREQSGGGRGGVGGPRGGGGIYGGRGGAGGFSGRPGGRSFERPQQFKLWTEVSLNSNTSPNDDFRTL